MGEHRTHREQVQAILDLIHDRLSGGATPVVEAELNCGGAWIVSWGVAGVSLEHTADQARELADVMDGEGYMPAIPPLLRAAADVCDAKTATLQ